MPRSAAFWLRLRWRRSLFRGTKNFQQPFHEDRRLENRLEQKQSVPGVRILRDGSQRPAQLRVLTKALGSRDQPQVELFFLGANIRQKLSMVALRIVNQVARMHLEKL